MPMMKITRMDAYNNGQNILCHVLPELDGLKLVIIVRII